VRVRGRREGVGGLCVTRQCLSASLSTTTGRAATGVNFLVQRKRGGHAFPLLYYSPSPSLRLHCGLLLFRVLRIGLRTPAGDAHDETPPTRGDAVRGRPLWRRERGKGRRCTVWQKRLPRQRARGRVAQPCGHAGRKRRGLESRPDPLARPLSRSAARVQVSRRAPRLSL
jgi:hypothetical protein